MEYDGIPHYHHFHYVLDAFSNILVLADLQGIPPGAGKGTETDSWIPRRPAEVQTAHRGGRTPKATQRAQFELEAIQWRTGALVRE